MMLFGSHVDLSDVQKSTDNLDAQYSVNKIGGKYPLMDFTLSHSGQTLFDNNPEAVSYSDYWASQNVTLKKRDEHQKLLAAFQVFSALNYPMLDEDKGFFMPTSGKSLRDLHVPVKIAQRVQEYLETFGYIQQVKAGSNLANQYTFFKFLKPIPLPKDAVITTNQDKKTVLVKDKDKKVLEEKQLSGSLTTEDYGNYKVAKRNLGKINTWLSKQLVKNHLNVQEPICLRRTFNNLSTTLGGRFYADYMSYSSSERAAFTISAKPVVSLDFKSMALRLLYAIKGVGLFKDPYELDDYERSDIKVLMTRMLGAKSVDGVLASIKREFDNLTATDIVEVRQMIVTLLEKHWVVKEYLCSNKDTALMVQFLESQLMESIMLECVAKKIPFLPVHDGLICTVDDQESVFNIMTNNFNKQYPQAAYNPEKHNYPLIEVE